LISRSNSLASQQAIKVPSPAINIYVKTILFVCGKNKWRSPTAEQLFAEHPGIECTSAGLSPESDTPISAELVEWAHLIFVMEKVHKAKLAARFKSELAGKRVVCLGIPDNYQFMDPALVKLLKAKVTPHLR
jgi:predicted protein tyrosine phosphatase